MIDQFVLVVTLTARAHVLWPEVPIARVIEAAGGSVMRATRELPASLLLSITQHESNCERSCVSTAQLHNVVLDDHPGLIPWGAGVCGYLQAMARNSLECLDMIAEDGGMRAGVSELETWLDTCRHDLRCALSGHAGGNQGVDDALTGVDSRSTQFADYFMWVASQLELPASQLRPLAPARVAGRRPAAGDHGASGWD